MQQSQQFNEASPPAKKRRTVSKQQPQEASSLLGQIDSPKTRSSSKTAAQASTEQAEVQNSTKDYQITTIEDVKGKLFLELYRKY